jgi:hypothetical protein
MSDKNDKNLVRRACDKKLIVKTSEVRVVKKI